MFITTHLTWFYARITLSAAGRALGITPSHDARTYREHINFAYPPLTTTRGLTTRLRNLQWLDCGTCWGSAENEVWWVEGSNRAGKEREYDVVGAERGVGGVGASIG